MHNLRSIDLVNKVCASAVAILLLVSPFTAHGQSRGVYPLGMSSTNSGITPASGFTYSNQLLFYYRNESKDQNGVTKPVTGSNAVLMDMNSIIWVSKRTVLGGANYSALATLPFAKNDLTSDINGNISGGGGFADSYYVPFILGWNKERVSVRLLYGFLAPTGRYASDASNNVGSGYWTHAISSGQTFSLTHSKNWAISTFEMYEFHTTQEGHANSPRPDLRPRLFPGPKPHLPKLSSSSPARRHRLRGPTDHRPLRPRHYTRPRRRPLRHQLHRCRLTSLLSKSETEPRNEVLRRIRRSLDLPGLLAPVHRRLQLLTRCGGSDVSF
jgi:hypothetical protein